MNQPTKGPEETGAAPSGDSTSAVVSVDRIGPPPWPTDDPFLFCVHHHDAYPRSDGNQAPAPTLAGRNIGSDFSSKDGWSMYHGSRVPGFPRHPHRGFETVTVVRRGLVDHCDSMGATARYGAGDTQWLTAGGGIQHAEMFPLTEQGRDNPLELFQIWLNLPAADKMAKPHFSMFWRDQVPKIVGHDAANRSTEVTVVAGRIGGAIAPAPPPDSYASKADSDVAIWTLRMSANAHFTLPPAASAATRRSLYLYDGEVKIGDDAPLSGRCRIHLRGDRSADLYAGAKGADLLLLQGKPIGEPVAHHGPFVMNTRAELQQAFADYHATGFGGWKWRSDDPVHDQDDGRFAVHADGRRESPKS
jgi:quercetin 2,3-dioxygenase